MLATGTFRYQESLDRAKAMGIERVIQARADDKKPRDVSNRQREQRRRTLLRELCDAQLASYRLERILQGNDLTDIGYLAQGLICARSVCRVVIREGQTLAGYGTGFMVAPGVMLTNEHVLSSPDDVRDSVVEFRYERDFRGNNLHPVEFALSVDVEPIIFEGLDMALVAVRPRATDGRTPLDSFG